MKYCTKCGAKIPDDARFCSACGTKFNSDNFRDNDNFSDDLKRFASTEGETSSKSRAGAAILCFFLGGLGAHQFYVGNTTKGVFMLIFCFSGIPFIISIAHFIMILCGTFTDSEGKELRRW